MAIVINKRPGDYSFTGNPVWYELYSAEAAADATIYFEVKIWFKFIGGAYAALKTIKYYPVAGTAKVDISAILDAKLVFFLPLISVSGRQTATEQSGMYYIETRQISTAIPDPAFVSDSAHEKYALKGGLNYFFHRGNNFFPNYQAISGSNRFLTWQQSGRLVSYNERMYLVLINAMPGDTETRSSLVTITYSDGTTATVSSAYTHNKGVIIFFPIGGAMLGLNSVTPTKEIVKWKLTILYDPGTGFEPISEAYEFILDQRNDYNEIAINFRNSLGGVDSMRVRGVVETSLNWDVVDAQRAVDADYYTAEAIPAQRFNVSSSERISYKGDAGFLNKEQQMRLRDLFMQRELWQELRGKWLPLNLTSTGFKMRTSDDTVWSMPIEWQPAYQGGDFFTPQSIDLGDE